MEGMFLILNPIYSPSNNNINVIIRRESFCHSSNIHSSSSSSQSKENQNFACSLSHTQMLFCSLTQTHTHVCVCVCVCVCVFLSEFGFVLIQHPWSLLKNFNAFGDGYTIADHKCYEDSRCLTPIIQYIFITIT